MNLEPAIFGAAFAKVSSDVGRAAMDARAVIREVEILGENIVVPPLTGHADAIAAAAVPAFSKGRGEAALPIPSRLENGRRQTPCDFAGQAKKVRSP